MRSLANAAKLLSPVIARFGQLNHPKWRPFWALRAIAAWIKSWRATNMLVVSVSL